MLVKRSTCAWCKHVYEHLCSAEEPVQHIFGLTFHELKESVVGKDVSVAGNYLNVGLPGLWKVLFWQVVVYLEQIYRIALSYSVNKPHLTSLQYILRHHSSASPQAENDSYPRKLSHSDQCVSAASQCTESNKQRNHNFTAKVLPHVQNKNAGWLANLISGT